VVLLDAVRAVLGRAVCAWSGLPVSDAEAGQRTRDFAAMVEGAVGPRNWRGQLLRHPAERWAGSVVRDIRSGALGVDPAGAAAVVARHRDRYGQLLPEEVARVELINVLRPTVVVARFVAFAALDLHQYPECRERAAEDPQYLRGSCTRCAASTRSSRWSAAGRCRSWSSAAPRSPRVVAAAGHLRHRPRPAAVGPPQSFRPERFRDREIDPFTLVPQGGGDHRTGHRCAGEWLTLGLMERAVRLPTTAMTYQVPLQNLGVDLSRMPAAPATGFRVLRVRPA
jgi:fatty-acid peroxygenase